MAFQVHLKNFQGPMDLLLYFIRRDELDIYDIPISRITKEFIEVIEQWKRLNMIIAGEFIDMASILMRIKAKILIPRPEFDEDGEIVDPRAELMQKLIDYKRYRDAAGMLKSMAEENCHMLPRHFDQVVPAIQEEEVEHLLQNVTLYDLARVFKKAMENRPVISQFELNREPVKLEQQKEIIFKFFDGDGRLKFSNLLKHLKTRVEIIVTFLAILDLVREGLCTLDQVDVFGDIELVHLGTEA